MHLTHRFAQNPPVALDWLPSGLLEPSTASPSIGRLPVPTRTLPTFPSCVKKILLVQSLYHSPLVSSHLLLELGLSVSMTIPAFEPKPSSGLSPAIRQGDRWTPERDKQEAFYQIHSHYLRDSSLIRQTFYVFHS